MTKASIFFLACLLIAGYSFAQQGVDSNHADRSIERPTYQDLQKGALTFTLNGSANNSEQKAGWSLTPQAGYLVADRWVVGVQLSMANRFSKRGNSWASLKRGGLKEFAFTPEVYTRYYVLPFRLTPFVQLSSGYNFGKLTGASTIAGEEITMNTNHYVMFWAVGLSLRIGKNMGLQTQYNLPLVVDSNTNDMIRGNRFRLGLSFYLR
ncbi:outer membrane beta-barrel protein [Dyadobacter tibetensis]|uniref:outer membrane beta-barrel protein n=1 Tax=Dyadobacter tibetensis TaxID=1211851 RepID=UPI0004715C5C|nr:outer membrane beta-barrel protein [Dyadobacter tibetensis]